MAALPQFKQRQLARRSGSDIQRLAQQYKAQVDSLTSEKQQAFGRYQAEVNTKLAPFNEAMAQYQNVDMPGYEAARADYQRKLDAYNTQLEALAADPVVARIGTREWKEPRFGLFGLAGYTTKRENFEYFEPKPVPTFSDKTPTAPTAPTAPAIEQFDSSQFDQRSKEVQSTFQREVGERRAAKLGAVSRRSTRPMLQGG